MSHIVSILNSGISVFLCLARSWEPVAGTHPSLWPPAAPTSAASAVWAGSTHCWFKQWDRCLGLPFLQITWGQPGCVQSRAARKWELLVPCSDEAGRWAETHRSQQKALCKPVVWKAVCITSLRPYSLRWGLSVGAVCLVPTLPLSKWDIFCLMPLKEHSGC